MIRYRKLILVVVFICALIWPLYQWALWEIYILNPNLILNKKVGYHNTSSDQLIKEMNWSNLWSELIVKEVSDRKEKHAVTKLIKLLSSPFKSQREEAIRALGEIQDSRAIEPLMNVVKKEKMDYEYFLTLQVLSKFHHKDIYRRVINLATTDPKKDPLDNRSYSIDMLKNFDTIETNKILRQISISDPKEYIRKKATSALTS